MGTMARAELESSSCIRFLTCVYGAPGAGGSCVDRQAAGPVVFVINTTAGIIAHLPPLTKGLSRRVLGHVGRVAGCDGARDRAVPVRSPAHYHGCSCCW